MNNLDFDMVLEQIDGWISSLSDDELPDKCQKSTDDFMVFMVARGVPKAELEGLILAATGLMPDNLGTLEGAQRLRAAIFNNNAARTDVLRSDSKGLTAFKKAQQWWSKLF